MEQDGKSVGYRIEFELSTEAKKFVDLAIVPASSDVSAADGIHATIFMLKGMTSAGKAYALANAWMPSKLMHACPEAYKAFLSMWNALPSERRMVEAFWNCGDTDDLRREWDVAKKLSQEEVFITIVSSGLEDPREVHGKKPISLVERVEFLDSIAPELSAPLMGVVEVFFGQENILGIKPKMENLNVSSRELRQAIGRCLIRRDPLEEATLGLLFGIDPIDVKGANSKLVDVCVSYRDGVVPVLAKRRRVEEDSGVHAKRLLKRSSIDQAALGLRLGADPLNMQDSNPTIVKICTLYSGIAIPRPMQEPSGEEGK